MKVKQRYPLEWKKNDFSIKIFCSIPNIATGILLKAGNSYFIIDPGDGILRDLNKELGTEKLLGISDIFVSHGHHDHIGGVWSLLTYLRVMNKKSTLFIYFPKGCREIGSIYNAFKKVYSKTINYKIKLIELNHTKAFRRKSVIIKSFPVIHKEYLHDGDTTRQVPAFGYTFSYGGKKICYGGDTAYCDELVVNAKNSDLAILEAGHDHNTPNGMHMTVKEAKSIGETAKEYFLVHVPE
jgi:ribonuclease Z